MTPEDRLKFLYGEQDNLRRLSAHYLFNWNEEMFFETIDKLIKVQHQVEELEAIIKLAILRQCFCN
jgi:hypothetical protein